MSDSGNLYLLPLINLLKDVSNGREAEVMKKYMKNNFEFYGVRAPQCKEILKRHIQIKGLPQNMLQLENAIHCAWK